MYSPIPRPQSSFQLLVWGEPGNETSMCMFGQTGNQEWWMMYGVRLASPGEQSRAEDSRSSHHRSVQEGPLRQLYYTL